MRQLTELERAGRKPRAVTWGARQKAIFVGAVITAVGLVVVAVFYFGRPQVLAVEDLSPYGTWQRWHDLRQGIELRPPWEQAYLDAAAAHRRWMVVGASVAALGAVVMAGSLVISRPRPKRPIRRPGSKARDRRSDAAKRGVTE